MTYLRTLGLAGALVLFGAQISSGSTASQSACTNNPEYPAPQEPEQLFYLQRTGNANTVIYVAKRDAYGKIDSRQPVAAYWRYFARNGEKSELGLLERMLAFGVEHQPVDGNPEKHLTNLVSYPARKAVVEQTSDGKPRAIMPIAGENAQLVCLYVEWREVAGIIPNVLYVDIVGRSLDGKRKIVERVRP